MSRRPSRLRSVLPILALAPLALGACAGPRNFDNENDALRRQLLEANTEIDRLKASEQRLAAALEAERSALSRRAPSEQAIALLPAPEKIVIGRLSGPVPAGDSVDLFLSPLDDRARFVQVAGTLIVRVDLIPPADGSTAAEPRMLASLMLSPAELREAYRAGVTGTHYSVRVPLSPPAAPGEGTLSASVRLDDLVTGARLEATAQWPAPGARP